MLQPTAWHNVWSQGYSAGLHGTGPLISEANMRSVDVTSPGHAFRHIKVGMHKQCNKWNSSDASS